MPENKKWTHHDHWTDQSIKICGWWCSSTQLYCFGSFICLSSFYHAFLYLFFSSYIVFGLANRKLILKIIECLSMENTIYSLVPLFLLPCMFVCLLFHLHYYANQIYITGFWHQSIPIWQYWFSWFWHQSIPTWQYWFSWF